MMNETTYDTLIKNEWLKRESLMFPKAFIQYLYYFHCERDYFECHEILEEYWKEDPPNERKTHWVAFIQCAVAQYHYRRRNIKGAERMLQNAIRLFMQHKNDVERLGVDYQRLHNLLVDQLDQMMNGKQYESIDIPIKSEALQQLCHEYAKERGVSFNQSCEITDFIIHKHTLRDRSEVIQERERQLKKRSREH